jgi:hypothetical protein
VRDEAFLRWWYQEDRRRLSPARGFFFEGFAIPRGALKRYSRGFAILKGSGLWVLAIPRMRRRLRVRGAVVFEGFAIPLGARDRGRIWTVWSGHDCLARWRMSEPPSRAPAGRESS